MSASNSPAQPSKSFNYHVHGFRGFAVLCVFIYHIFSTHVISRALPQFDWTMIETVAASLKYGVELFFMVSGYVIVGSLRRHDDVGRFFVDRAIRIYPAFVPVLVLIFLVGALMATRTLNLHVSGWEMFQSPDPVAFIGNFVANLLFIPPILPLPLAHWSAWSLSYEWIFYGFAAWFFALRGSNGMRRALGFGIAGVAILLLFNWFPRAVFFLPGVAVFLWRDWIAARAGFFRFPLPAFLVLMFAWAAIGSSWAQPIAQLQYWVTDIRLFDLVVALAAGFYLFAAIVNGQGLFSLMLASPVFRFLGTISYSFYLWSSIAIIVVRHVAMPIAAPHLDAPSMVIFYVVASTIASVASSWVSWYLFENKLARRIKQAIDGRRGARAPTVSTVASPAAMG